MQEGALCLSLLIMAAHFRLLVSSSWALPFG
jgi:hypothetical protein